MRFLSIDFKKISLFYYLIIISAFGFSQEAEYLKEIDLGKIKKTNEDVVDLLILNPIDTPLTIERVEANSSLRFQSRRDYIPARRGEVFRVKLNPSSRGRFNEGLRIYFDNLEQPLDIRFSGNMRMDVGRGLQDCPDFDNMPSSREIAKRNRRNRGNIQRFQIDLKQIQQAPEEENGIVTKREESQNLLQKLFGPDLFSNEENDTLDQSFKPNNLVFLIDASSSMEREGKFELLKESMMVMLGPLREVDYLSIITYAGNAQILMPPTSSVNKDSIAKVINSLSAEGSTNAVKGLQLAVKTGRSNFIDGGNNQIFLVTDGAFKLGGRNERSRDEIQRAANEGLSTSVLAIKSQSWTYRSLKEISRLGEGKMLKINRKDDRDKILKMIKKKSAG